ncbi:MAG: hypothetical protein PHT60_12005 [Acidiphilium sp.]|nr:hypothetical protein [Acidiphilium sp.]MDD4936484.1 hypothetical protein [Acidiphilium sp.]
MLMIAITSLSAFAAPIGPSSLGIPPLRYAPAGPQPGQPSAPQATQPPSGPGPMPRGSLLNMSV